MASRPNRPERARIVGDRAHGVVGRVLAAGGLPGGLPGGRLDRATVLLEAARDVLRERPADVRGRAVLAEAAGAAAAYFHFFAPPTGWRLAGAEVPLSTGRADLVFEDADGRVVIDELKFGLGRGGVGAVRAQVERYRAGGLEAWGGRFVGVRLCAVAEPLASRFYPPTGTRYVRLDARPKLSLDALPALV